MNSEKKLAKQISDGVIEFLKKNKNQHLLNLVIENLQKAKSVKKAVVYSPVELSKGERSNLTQMIAKLTGEKVEDYDFRIDESLIDGLKIIYNDRLWDFSVANQIKSISKK